jgi:hypothetical protein
MIDARSVSFDVIADREQRADLLARYKATRPHLLGSKFGFRLGEADLDAVRAARCLVEHKVDKGDFYTSVAYITDREMAADIVRRTVESAEANAKTRAEEEAAWRERSGQIEQTPDEQKEAGKAERAKAAKASVKARTFNADLGRNLVKRREKEPVVSRASRGRRPWPPSSWPTTRTCPLAGCDWSCLSCRRSRSSS